MSELTKRVHELLRDTLRADDFAIDATAGNGFDTLALAECVPSGRVLAFDVQEAAIQATRSRLQQNLLNNVEVVHASHSQMLEAVPASWHHHVGAIVFNLGYLPGGNKSLTTEADSTKLAIIAGMNLLRIAGVITVVGYRGHEAGRAEVSMLESLSDHCDRDAFAFDRFDSAVANSTSPVLFVIRRLA